MSDSNHSLNQSSKDVFAKPLLAAASLLDGSLALDLTQTPSQLSNSPNASIDPLTQPAQIAALAEAKSTDTLAVDNPTVFDLPQTLPPTIEQNGKDLITGNPLPRQVGIAASLPERGAAIQLIHLDDVSPEVHLASEVAVESAASVGATPVELPQAATSTQPFQSPRANLPLVGIIDTGLDRNIPSVNYESLTLGYDWVDGDFDPLLDGISSHGTRVLNVVQTTQTQPLPFNGQLAPTWIGRGVGAGNWANSLTEFVDYARSSGETGAVANLSFDLTETDANGNPTTRNFLTVTELAALQYAQQAGVLVVVAAGNQGEVLSALGATSTQFDNLITVGALDGAGRAAYSSYGNGLTLLAPGGTPDAPLAVVSGGSTTPAYGTSYAAAQVTGAISLIWQVNPDLNYQQMVEVLQQTATDLQISGWDEQTGYGALNLAAAISLAKQTLPLPLHSTAQTSLPSPSPSTQRLGERAANEPATSGNADALAGQTHILWRDQTTGDNGIWVMDGVQMQSFVPLAARDSHWRVGGMSDLNRDGKTDILWWNGETRNLDMWFMDGTHLLSSQALNNAVVPTDWQVRTTGDFNGDGNPDIVLQEYDVTGHTTGNNVVWFMNGTSLVSMGGLVWSGEVWQIQGTADFNRDSNTDLFWYNRQDTAATWLLQGTSIAGIDAWYSGVGWNPGAIGDLNGDGHVDILWDSTIPDAAGNRAIAAWLMNGNQIAAIPFFPSVGGDWLPVATFRSTVPSPPTNLVVIGSNTSNVTSTSTPTLTGQAQPFALVQLLDESGRSVGQALADAAGNWQVTTLPLAEGRQTITARVIDAMGVSSFISTPLNLVVDTISPTLSLNSLGAGGILTHASRLIGTAQGTGTDVATLQYQFDNLPPVAMTFSSIGAFDQAIDLTGVTSGSHTLRVTVTDQAGLQTTEQFQVTVNLNSAAQPIASDAQTLAGSTHILWRDSSNGDNGVWVMNQTEVQSFVPLPNMPLNWSVPGMNDFNRDGKTDILWWDQTDGNLLLWLMDGTQVLSTQSLPSGMMGTDWQARGVGDLNGDGHADIVWQQDASSSTAVWYMNATTMTSTAPLPPTGPDWRIQGTADLDRNGTPDILWYNYGNSHTAAWMMQDSTIIDVANYGLVGGAWYLGGAGDLNRDGHADLVWNSIVPDANGTRSTIAWMMNGTTGVWGETLPSVSGSWLPVTPFRTTIPAPPANLAVVGSSSNITNTSNPTIRGQAEPFALIKLTLGDGTALGQVLADAQGNWQSSLSGLAEGQHTLTARAINAQGVSSFVSNPLNITVDTIPPTLSLNSLGAGGILTRASRLIGTASETGTGIATLQYQFDDRPPIAIALNSTGAFDQAIDLTGVTSGSHTLIVRVIDQAGLQTTQQFQVTVNPNSSTTPNPSTAQDLAGPTHVFWRDYSTGDNGIWIMDGLQVQSFLPLPSASLNWQPEGLSDFNRDEKTDILWWDQTSGNLNLWFMDGTQLLSTQSLSSPFAGTDWAVGGTGDFNDDGKPDILWQRQSTTENAVWFMDGTTLTSISPVSGRGHPTWELRGIGDFNRDGNPDLAWSNDWSPSTMHNTGFWIMQGTSLQAVLDYNHVHGDWLLAGAGDFNNDGQADILWNDLIPNAQGTRTTALWMLQDPSLLNSQLSGHILKPTPPLWLLPDTQIPSLPQLPSVSGGWRPVSPFRTMLPQTPSNLAVSGSGGAANTPMITGQAEAFALVKLTDSYGTFLGQSLADAQGNWQVITPALADGKYAIRARAIDAVGVSSFVSNPLNVTIGDLPPEPPRFTSTPLQGATLGTAYQYAITTLDPDGDVRTITPVSPLPAWLTLVDNGDGTALLRGTPTQLGLYSVSLKATDALGLSEIQTFFVGTDLQLQEGSRFGTTHQVSFVVPSNSSVLQFQLDGATFDGTDLRSINDAFEVALVDADGRSIVHSTAPNQDTFFNWTEGEAVALGTGASYSSQTRVVSLNLTGLEPGTNATLIFRLVNNDQDTTTNVQIRNLALVAAPTGTTAPVQSNFASELTTTSIDPTAFASMRDVSATLAVEYGRTSFNADQKLLYADVAIRNTGRDRVDVPLLVAITNISDPSVVLRSPDGYTPDGLPYYNMSHLVTNGKLNPNGLTNSRSLVFYNPDGVQFTYEAIVLGQTNRNPVIHSKSIEEVPVGKFYRYRVQASDPDSDTLAYRLLAAPANMFMNSSTGEIQWTPGTADVGNHAVLIEVTDGRGGISRQQYSLAVTNGVPNRSPNITSIPIIEAVATQPYSYQATATDADLDTLTFSKVGNTPAWVLVSPGGIVYGTPSINDIGEQTVAIQVSDGRGGTQTQSFSLRVNQVAGNVAPRIVSTPIQAAYLSTEYTYQVRAIDPNEQDKLQYSLLKKPDSNMSIDPNTGRIVWYRTVASASPYEVQVQVSDGRGGVDQQTFWLTVPNTQTGTGEIQGIVWTDADGDGIKDTDERGMADVEVYLDLNHNGIFDAGDLKTRTTSDDVLTSNVDETGQYRFTNLNPGTYTVRQLIPTGFNSTSPAASFSVGANVIRNGSFEVSPTLQPGRSWQTVYANSASGILGPTAIPNWQVTSGTVDYCLDGLWEASNGRASIDLEGEIPGSISQTFETVVGQEYLVTFDLAVHSMLGAGTVRSTVVSAAGQSQEFFATGSGNPWKMGYQPKSWRFVANSTSTTLRFAAGSSPSQSFGASLDNVIVAPILSSTPDYRHLATVNAGQITRNINFGNQPIPTFAINHDPQFTSIAPATAPVNTRFEYQAKATDLDFNPLRYDLLVKPEGMAIDSTTGLIWWTPTADQLVQTNNGYLGRGVYNVFLRVTDGQGGIDFQSFNLKVTAPNIAPIFTQLPANPTIRINTPFSYALKAEDLDQEPNTPGVRYSLGASTSTGININPTTGELTGTFTSTGEQTVTVIATDHRGATREQALTFKVVESTNIAPEIISNPRRITRPDVPYFYRPTVVDQDGEPTTFQLLSGPTGMTIQNGVITWTPTAAQIGTHVVSLQASDGRLTSTPQTFTLNVANQAPNSVPQIAPVPNLVTSPQNLFAYDLQGSDSDWDAMVWSLAQAPTGMTINSVTGALRWQPTANHLGTHEVVVKLTDAYGLEATRSFTITNNRANLAPLIQSSPHPIAVAGQVYRSQLVAKDPEDGVLTYSLAAANLAQGISINAQTGEITWTPPSNLIGTTQTVEVRVTDAQGGEVRHTYGLRVDATATNQPPRITSTPRSITQTGAPYIYQVIATDDGGSSNLSYRLITRPSTNMQIDATTGLLQWNNPTTSTGSGHVVEVEARDSQGTAFRQRFNLVVRTNAAPVLQAAQLPTAAPNTPYRFDFKATDINPGDPLTYTLDAASRDKGMQIDDRGRLTWTPTLAQLGNNTSTIHSVAVTVTDELGASDTKTYQLTLAKDTIAPQVRVFPTQSLVEVGSSATFVAQATDNVRVANVTMTINGIPVLLDNNGRVTIDLNQPQWRDFATLTAQVKATDTSGNESSILSVPVQVINPRAVFNPNSTFDLPDVVTSPTQFRVGGQGVVGYKLEVAPVGGDEWKTLAQSGPQAIADTTMVTFDPSLLQNDTYTARLTLLGANGEALVLEDTVDVVGDLKLGNFRLSFTDLSIPVTGIPITLTRTYDTLNSNETDDFGYGWRMEFRDTDLRTSLRRSEEDDLMGRYPAFDDRTKVFITLPGGKREAFKFQAKQVTQIDGVNIGGFASYFFEPTFVADKGGTSTLTLETKPFIRPRSDGKYMGQQGQPFNPADPMFGGVYVLTTKDGTKYRIDARTGDLLTLTDTNGNVLTYTDGAITSSTGQRVTFERDARGRITSVKDPVGNVIRYDYDANGDLISVTDRENNVTQFVYDSTYDDPEIPGTNDGGRKRIPHYLRTIIDPLGRTGARADYDEITGRLKEMLDANGEPVEFLYEPNNSRQTVYDQLRRRTTYEYDDRGNIVTEIDAVGKVTRRKFNPNTNFLDEETVITPETGANGFTTKYTYDNRGNQLTRTNPLGETDYYTYNSLNQLLTSTDAMGNTTLYTYDGRGNVLSKTDSMAKPDGTSFTTTYTYDSLGRNRSIVEGANDVTEFDYDQFGNRTLKRHRLGNGMVYETTYTYDLNGNIRTETQRQTTPTGVKTLVTTKTYDKNGRVKTLEDAERGVTQYDYDANGNQTLVIDPLQRRTVMRYNAKNQLIETIYDDDTPLTLLDNSRTSMSYDAVGNKTSITDQSGKMTTYSYDALNRPTGMVSPDETPATDADNPKIVVEYDRLGRMKTLVKDGVTSEFGYDAAGRMTRSRVTQNGQVYETKTDYDKAGRAIAKTDARGTTTRYEYDSLDRVTATIYADGSRTSTTYDASGDVTSRTDQAGRTTRYEYDGLDRLRTVIDERGNRTEYRYDELSNLISQRDANGRFTRYEYDGLGRRTAVVRPMGERSETSYNQVGNIIQTQDFNGAIVTYNYDKINRLTTKNYVTEGRSQQFTFTETGKLDTYTDERGITDYNYDPLGRLVSRINPDNQSISYTYDPVTNKVASVITPSGTTSHQYNSLGQLAKVISGDDETTYTYNEIGNLATVTLPNGVTQTYQYDTLDRLKLLETKNQAGTTLARYTYGYDSVGNRTSVEELGGRKVEYIYDSLYRLTQEKITDAVAGNRTVIYTYDNVGNRLTKQDSVAGTTTYTYNNNDRLLTETTSGVTTTYTYDNNGNTQTETQGSNQTLYTWNSNNQLTGASITKNGQTQQLSYRYDINGVRVASIVDGVETRYLIDENRPYAQVLEEYSSNGTMQARYVYGGDLDLISQTRGSTESIYLRDGHSGVRQLTNAVGGVTDTYTYDAYGNLLRSTGTTQNNYQYRGEQSDSNLGMQYLRARYYDQTTGRFASVDPFEGVIAAPMSRHRYMYGYNNPIYYSDPSGLFSLSETQATLVLLTATASSLQASYGSYLRKVTGDVKWEGYSANLSRAIPGSSNLAWKGMSPLASLGGFFFDLTSDEVDGYKTRGMWLALGYGGDISPPSRLPDIGGSLEVTFWGPTTTVVTPKIYGGRSVWTLAGGFLYAGFDAVLGAGVGINTFSLGFGQGQASPNPAVGLSLGATFFTGFSIPLPPYGWDIPAPEPTQK